MTELIIPLCDSFGSDMAKIYPTAYPPFLDSFGLDTIEIYPTTDMWLNIPKPIFNPEDRVILANAKLVENPPYLDATFINDLVCFEVLIPDEANHFVKNNINDLEIIWFIMENKKFPDAMYGTFRSAYSSNKIEIVKFLLEKGADIHQDRDGALRYCAKFGFYDLAKLLLDNGADPNGLNILMDAVRSGNIEFVKLLLERGVDVNVDSPNDGNSISVAIFSNNIDMLKLLLENGADPNNHKRWNPLWLAIKLGFYDSVKLLIEKNCQVNMKDNCLEVACENGHTAIAELLIQNGADINQGSGAALISAVHKQHYETVKLLLTHGANLFVRNDAPIRIAYENGNQAIIKLLTSN